MDRTVFLYKQEKLNIVPMPVDYKVSLRSWTESSKPDLETILKNLMPNADAMQQSTTVLYEYLALMFYRLAAIF